MLLDLDQSTLANMTAALEYLCRRLPPDKDNHDARKQIADAMIAGAKAGSRSYVDLLEAGTKVQKEIFQPARNRWFSWL